MLKIVKKGSGKTSYEVEAEKEREATLKGNKVAELSRVFLGGAGIMSLFRIFYEDGTSEVKTVNEMEALQV
jgi:hypothetical protein